MSNGEKMHEAFREAIVKDMAEGWFPDWEGIVGSTYEKFIEDLRDDVFVTLNPVLEDKETGKFPIGTEVSLISMINDTGMQGLGTPSPLSDILFKLFEWYREENAGVFLSNSIKALRDKVEAKGWSLPNLDDANKEQQT
jgi:hypothetical protein